MKGRSARLPDAVKEARGTLRKSRVNTKMPKPPKGAPTMPMHVRSRAEARKLWETLVPILTKMKVISTGHGAPLEALCMAYQRALDAEELVREEGILITTKRGGLQANPACTVARSAWTEVRKLATEFGLTPASQSGVSERDEDEDENEPSEDTDRGFLFRGSKKVAGSIG